MEAALANSVGVGDLVQWGTEEREAMGGNGAGPKARGSTGRTEVAARDLEAASAGSGDLVHLQFGAADRLRRKIRLLVCDSHRLFSEALAVLLEDRGYEIVASVLSVDAAVAVVREREVDVCVMALRFPDGSGTEGAARVIRQSPRTRIVLLTGAEHPAERARARHAGARAIVAKTDAVERLLDTIDRVHDGEILVGDGDERPRPPGPAPLDSAGLVARFLTQRERQVLEYLAAGMSTVELTRALGVKASTARTHIQSTLNKLGVHSKLEAVVFAVTHGLVASPQVRTPPARREGVVQLPRLAAQPFEPVRAPLRASSGGG